MRTMFKTFAGCAVLATAFFALAVTGCSDDSGNNSFAEKAQVRSKSELGSCAEENKGERILVLSQGVYFTCNGNEWSDSETKSESSNNLDTDDSEETDSSASGSEDNETEPSSETISSDDGTSSSGDTESSSSTVKTSASSATSTTTPLLDYELTQPFIDEGWRDECLRLLNEYRATEDLEPMTLADAEKQQCAIDQAAADMADGTAHGHFGDCGESAQNSGPNFSTSWKSNATGAVQYYEMSMWEKEKALVEQGVTEYQQIGHYLNMKNSYSKVACGIAISADGKTGWFNMNFYY